MPGCAVEPREFEPVLARPERGVAGDEAERGGEGAAPAVDLSAEAPIGRVQVVPARFGKGGDAGKGDVALPVAGRRTAAAPAAARERPEHAHGHRSHLLGTDAGAVGRAAHRDLDARVEQGRVPGGAAVASAAIRVAAVRGAARAARTIAGRIGPRPGGAAGCWTHRAAFAGNRQRRNQHSGQPPTRPAPAHAASPEMWWQSRDGRQERKGPPAQTPRRAGRQPRAGLL